MAQGEFGHKTVHSRSVATTTILCPSGGLIESCVEGCHHNYENILRTPRPSRLLAPARTSELPVRGCDGDDESLLA